jgi:alkanesulfonate monooxygenase SsuD/methylene tetrahydromethanopterin reductase-like flavin-dependent oxidoreductase (luciferase family)
MSAQNPIRVAEDVAILDHLTQGRCFVGFSRGYQSRWTNVLGQHLGSSATPSDGGEADEINRRVFEEQVDMVLAAWTQESIEHRSDLWQIPYPYEDGLRGWPMAATADMGAPGEMDESGALRRVSVVPAPYTEPHPPVFVASNVSVETVSYCGRKGFIPTYFTGINRVADHADAYVEAAHSVGQQLALGQQQALVRWPQIGATRADAHDAVMAYDADIFKHFYTAFLPQRADGLPHLPPDPSREQVLEIIAKSGLWAMGSVSEVRDEFVRQWRRVPAEYVVLITHFAQMPAEVVIRNLELFMTEIKPALDEIVTYEDRHAEQTVAAP